MAPNARGVVDDILAEHKVRNSRVGVLGPFGHRVRPALAHAAGLGRLQTASGTAAGHPVADAVRVLMHDNVVLKRSVALRAREIPEEHTHAPGLAATRMTLEHSRNRR